MPLVPGQAARRAVLDHHPEGQAQVLVPALALEAVVGTAVVVVEEGTILVVAPAREQEAAVGGEDTRPTRLL